MKGNSPLLSILGIYPQFGSDLHVKHTLSASVNEARAPEIQNSIIATKLTGDIILAIRLFSSKRISSLNVGRRGYGHKALTNALPRCL